MVYNWGESYSKQFLRIICQMHPLKGRVLTKTFENYLCRNIHVICIHFGAPPLMWLRNMCTAPRMETNLGKAPVIFNGHQPPRAVYPYML